MNIQIYYFSGTGNSMTVAKDIADKTDGQLVAIAKTVHMQKVNPQADIIGIVFPIYYGELPVIVKEFARKLTNLKGKYIFAVAIFGGAASMSLGMLKQIINANKGDLSASYRVQMPQNSFKKTYENKDKLFMKWETKVLLIAKNTRHRKNFIDHTNFIIEPIMRMLHNILIIPACKKALAEHAGKSIKCDMDLLIHHSDNSFYTNENCNSCSICVNVCPKGNITLQDSKPMWHNDCENCLACYNFCPNHAICGSITTKDFFYHHPKVKASNISMQANIL